MNINLIKEILELKLITKITRIQNKGLWKNYHFELQKMRDKGTFLEKYLIYEDNENENENDSLVSGIDEAFNVKSYVGNFGKGAYFS